MMNERDSDSIEFDESMIDLENLGFINRVWSEKENDYMIKLTERGLGFIGGLTAEIKRNKINLSKDFLSALKREAEKK